MHVRYFTALGLPVTDEEQSELLGTISGILIHPDTGKVEGFFVRRPGFFAGEELFLSTLDIIRFGLRVIVRHGDVLSPIRERIRLQSLLEEGRRFLSQKIVTESSRTLGTCKDVQFETQSFGIEWFWPKVLWRWGTPLPISQIIEVRRDAILVRDPQLPANEKESEETAPILRQPEAA